jgi:hypothetical protein
MINILHRVPQDLRDNERCLLGAWREATKVQSKGADIGALLQLLGESARHPHPGPGQGTAPAATVACPSAHLPRPPRKTPPPPGLPP